MPSKQTFPPPILPCKICCFKFQEHLKKSFPMIMTNFSQPQEIKFRSIQCSVSDALQLSRFYIFFWFVPCLWPQSQKLVFLAKARTIKYTLSIPHSIIYIHVKPACGLVTRLFNTSLLSFLSPSLHICTFLSTFLPTF